MCSPAVPQPTFRSVISYLWTKLRIVCPSFMNSTTDQSQRQPGFMYNRKHDIAPWNDYHKIPIYMVFENFLYSAYPQNAVVSEIHWRKCCPSKGNKALHEFLVLYLTEICQKEQKGTETEMDTEKGKGKKKQKGKGKGKEKESRNENQLERSVIVVERRPQKSRRQGQAETPGINRNGNGSNVSINSSRDSLQTSSSTEAAEDNITFSRTGTDSFIKTTEFENETLKGFKVKAGTNQGDMLFFTQVLAASYAVSQAKPAYTLPRHNCYYFAWQTYKILEEIIIEKGTYEALTIKSPKYEAGRSIASIIEGYNESLYTEDVSAVREEYTKALNHVNACMEERKLKEERVQKLETKAEALEAKAEVLKAKAEASEAKAEASEAKAEVLKAKAEASEAKAEASEAKAEAWRARGLFLEEALRRTGVDPTTLTPPQSISLT